MPIVKLSELLKKYDGQTVTKKFSRTIENKEQCLQFTYKLISMPQFLILHLQRFVKTDFGLEKNHTFIQFQPEININSTDYSLLAVVVHDSQEKGTTQGQYLVHIKKENDTWLSIQDLIVKPIMLEQVVLSECYMLVFKQK